MRIRAKKRFFVRKRSRNTAVHPDHSRKIFFFDYTIYLRNVFVSFQSTNRNHIFLIWLFIHLLYIYIYVIVYLMICLRLQGIFIELCNWVRESDWEFFPQKYFIEKKVFFIQTSIYHDRFWAMIICSIFNTITRIKPTIRWNGVMLRENRTEKKKKKRRKRYAILRVGLRVRACEEPGCIMYKCR